MCNKIHLNKEANPHAVPMSGIAWKLVDRTIGGYRPITKVLHRVPQYRKGVWTKWDHSLAKSGDHGFCFIKTVEEAVKTRNTWDYITLAHTVVVKCEYDYGMVEFDSRELGCGISAQFMIAQRFRIVEEVT